METAAFKVISPYDVPPLETERLLLRKWRLADAEDMFAYASDPEVTRFAMWKRHETIEDTLTDLREAEQRYAAHDWLYWGLEDRSSGRFIGSVGFVIWRPSDRNAEIGYALSRDFWGRGLMTEAVERVIDYGWSEMDLHRLEAKCILKNTRSIALLKRFGFREEGIRREAAYTPEGYLDIGAFGLLRHEYIK